MTGQIRGIWTNETAVARFRELLAAKEPFSIIARILNTEFRTSLTRNAVIGKAGRMGLTNGRGKGSSSRADGDKPKVSRRGGFIFKKRPPDESALQHPLYPNMEEADPTEHYCTLFDLTNETCRWPLGKWNEPAALFCGNPKADLTNHQPYCRTHARRAGRIRQVALMWQPIETRPADTRILLWDDGMGKCVVGKWCSDLEYWMLGYGAEYQPNKPTHWMPLPNRP